jgi:carboxyl-terminal processing protease
VLHLPVDQALSLIRGRVGTPVELLILRSGEPGPRLLTLRRSSLRFASVTGRVFEEHGRGRIGYVRVRSFQETTTAELSEHLERMTPGRPGLVGIVLDLRDNPGGVLEQAIRVADLFLERGTIVTMRSARGQREAVPARWYRSISSAPLIVLVNEGTASAGELVAGALKFNHRALLVGSQTFGKDSIQSVFPLSGGSALKLTVARFLPAGGQPIDGRGIVPHVWLRPIHEGPAGFEGLLHTSTGIAPEALRGLGSRDPHPMRELPHLLPAPGPDGPQEAAPQATAGREPDYALTVARRLLLANLPQGQSALLRQALDWVQVERRQQDVAIARRLAAAGVDWSHGGGDDGGQVELLRVTAQVRPAGSRAWTPLPEGAPVPAGARLRLGLTVRNAGALPLHRVLCLAESDAPWLRRREVPIGRLAAGHSGEATLELDVPADVPQGLEALRLRIYDGQRRLHYRATVLLALDGARQPRLQITLQALDDGSAGSRGNGDRHVQPGEVLALRVALRNLGPADAGPGRFWLSGGAAGQARLVRPWQAMAPIPAGGQRDAVLLLELGRLPAAGPPPGAPHLGSTAVVRLNLMNDSAALREWSWPLVLDRSRPLPRDRMEAPAIDLRAPERPVESARIVLRGAARDDRSLHDLVVYRNGRKLLYLRAPGEAATELPLRLALPLEPGRNLVQAVARDRDGLVTSRSFLLWQGHGQGFPISSPPGGGA